MKSGAIAWKIQIYVVTFTGYLTVYMGVAICLIAYVIFVIAKAFDYERAGSTIMLITVLAVLAPWLYTQHFRRRPRAARVAA